MTIEQTETAAFRVCGRRFRHWCMCLVGSMGQSYHLWDYDWMPLSQNLTQVEKDMAAPREYRLSSDSWSPTVPASGLPAFPGEHGVVRPAVHQDWGSGADSLCPGIWGMAGKAGAPSPYTLLLGNLVLNHSWMICFWFWVYYIAEQLPHCSLLKVSPWHKGFVIIRKLERENNENKILIKKFLKQNKNRVCRAAEPWLEGERDEFLSLS